MDRRVAVKNQARALLRSLGVMALAAKTLWSRKGLAWLEAQVLDEADSLRRDLLVQELCELNQKIKRVEKQLAQRANAHPGVTLLRTIPGVGIRTAEAFVAYVDNVQRFSRNKKVASYLGLVPCQDASAGKDRLGHITKDGPGTVRKMLCEAAWQAIRRSPSLKSFFDRVMHDDADRKKIALVATARHLAIVMAAMLRSGQVWEEQIAIQKENWEGRPAAGNERLSPPEDTEAP
jgi:transposase